MARTLAVAADSTCPAVVAAHHIVPVGGIGPVGDIGPAGRALEHRSRIVAEALGCHSSLVQRVGLVRSSLELHRCALAPVATGSLVEDSRARRTFVAP